MDGFFRTNSLNCDFVTYFTILVFVSDLLIVPALPSVPKGWVSSSQVNTTGVRLAVFFLCCLAVAFAGEYSLPVTVALLLLYKTVQAKTASSVFSPRQEPYTGVDDKLPKEVCTVTPDYHCEHQEVGYESQFLPQYVPSHVELASTPEPALEDASPVNAYEKGSYYEWN